MKTGNNTNGLGVSFSIEPCPTVMIRQGPQGPNALVKRHRDQNPGFPQKTKDRIEKKTETTYSITFSLIIVTRITVQQPTHQNRDPTEIQQELTTPKHGLSNFYKRKQRNKEAQRLSRSIIKLKTSIHTKTTISDETTTKGFIEECPESTI